MAVFKKLYSVLMMIVLDAIGVVAAFGMSLWILYEFRIAAIPSSLAETYLSTILYWAAFSVVVFAAFRLYNSIWSFVSLDVVLRIVGAYVVLLIAGGVTVIAFELHMPRSYYFIGFMLSALFTLLIRFSYRFLLAIRQYIVRISTGEDEHNVMVVGAGEAARVILREYQSPHAPSGRIACLIDDNEAKQGKILEGVTVVGNRNDIPTMAKRYKIDEIIYAIPTSDGQTRRDILEICSHTGCEVKVLPGVYQLVNGQVSVSKLRNVELVDLLGRDPVSVNLDEITGYIRGKVVMVTGGGGSIGSELCRQIAKSSPELLLIFDIYENNAYDIQMELKRHYPDLNLVVLIGSVRNTSRIDYVLGKYRPDIVFHAAAHKHVPLMEDSPTEAVKNNVFGTYKMATMSVKYGVKKFVLISTDKAVNPTNIMGASKRICEMIVQMMSRESTGTDFVAVRFGNVLGSNGSVIPLFEKQIAEGGPVTVTHPGITRFFMTIPEAVSLVLQAGYYARGGEIFVLDMGKPVKIADMARNLIRLSGYEPDVDIKIEYTGLRPGEKLYEEILMAEEGLRGTENSRIHIGRPIEMDDEKFKCQLARLEEAYKIEDPNIRDIVEEIVPTYNRAEVQSEASAVH